MFLYVRAQNTLGAAKTSAYYAVAPFIGAFLSFVILREALSWTYLVALAVMIAGTVLVCDRHPFTSAQATPNYKIKATASCLLLRAVSDIISLQQKRW